MANRDSQDSGKKDYVVGKGKPPKNRQFGQPGGNKRGSGFWNKENTPRFKLERMITMSDAELQEIIDDPDAPTFEKAMADIIIQAKSDCDKDGVKRPAQMRFKAISDMIDQIYGKPAQTTVNVDAGDHEKAKAFIRGVFIP
jgi:hypothetical protein